MRTTERKAMLRHIFEKEKATPVDALIDAVLEEMHQVGVQADEYPKLMAYLERLHEVKAKQRRDPVSRDTLALIGGNLLGILLIVAYEQKHVMTSKGFTQIIRPKITE
jgi:hypothetical protein